MNYQHTSPTEDAVRQTFIQSPSLYSDDENDQNRWSRISATSPQAEQQLPNVSHQSSGFTLYDNGMAPRQPSNQVVFEPQSLPSSSQETNHMKRKRLDWTIERDLRT